MGAVPFDILRGGGIETKNKNAMVNVGKKSMAGEICEKGKMWSGGLTEKKVLLGRQQRMFRNVPSVITKILPVTKISWGGAVKKMKCSLRE